MMTLFFIILAKKTEKLSLEIPSRTISPQKISLTQNFYSTTNRLNVHTQKNHYTN